MNVSDAYNDWAATYDEVVNKTRDLEFNAIRKTLTGSHFETCVELGCGTGKNTGWLTQLAENVIALDFSTEMLQFARQKYPDHAISFRETDLLKSWPVANESADLITCSLVLEHIPDLDFVFSEAARILIPGGVFYGCELHPVRQYRGSGANFIGQSGETTRPLCYTHHVTDYTCALVDKGFTIYKLEEWFDENDRTTIPRLLSFVAKRK